MRFVDNHAQRGVFMTDVNVLVVAENPLARMGLVTLLSGQAGLRIAGQTSGGAALTDELDLYRPDVLVWDWGWGAAPELPANCPVVALLKEHAQAAEAWAAGVHGLLPGTAEAESIAAAVLAAAQGLAVLDPELASALLPNPMPSDVPLEALTGREMEVLQLLAEGLPNKLIAARLGITDHTVKFHVNAIMGKLGVQSRTEAVVRATRSGLIIL
jgi:DNA-binding NarL/FixJ family response regulator